jgi:hypothetical protein
MALIEIADFSALLFISGQHCLRLLQRDESDGTKPKEINVERNGDQP